MNFFIISSLLLQLAFSAPLSPDPQFKVIFHNGIVTAESKHLQNVEINHAPSGNLRFTFVHKMGSRTDQMTFTKSPNRQYSDLTFVIERKPGHNCNQVGFPPIPDLWMVCNGEMQLRPMNPDEIAKSTQTSTVLTSLRNDNMKIKLTHKKGKQTIEGDFKAPNYVNVQNNQDSISVRAYTGYAYNGYQTIFGRNLYSDESFVVECSDNTNCQETNIRPLVISYCAGYLKVRKINAGDHLEDRPQRDGSEDLFTGSPDEDYRYQTNRPDDNRYQPDRSREPRRDGPKEPRRRDDPENEDYHHFTDRPDNYRRPRDGPKEPRPRRGDHRQGDRSDEHHFKPDYPEEPRFRRNGPRKPRSPRNGRPQRDGPKEHGPRRDDHPLTDRPDEYRLQTDRPDEYRYTTDLPDEYRYRTDRPDEYRYRTDLPEEHRFQTDLPKEDYQTDRPDGYSNQTDRPEENGPQKPNKPGLQLRLGFGYGGFFRRLFSDLVD